MLFENGNSSFNFASNINLSSNTKKEFNLQDAGGMQMYFLNIGLRLALSLHELAIGLLKVLSNKKPNLATGKAPTTIVPIFF